MKRTVIRLVALWATSVGAAYIARSTPAGSCLEAVFVGISILCLLAAPAAAVVAWLEPGLDGAR